MSITQDLKGYADAAVETGRSVINDGLTQSRSAVNERLTQLRTTLDDTIDGAGERAGKLAETVTGTGTQAVDRARLNAYATVGTFDAVVTTVVTRLQEFPNDVAGAVARAQNAATDAAEMVQTRVNQAARRAGDVAQDARPASLRSQAQERLADLAARGESVVTELRQDPRVVRVAGLVGAATDNLEQVAAGPARSRAAEKAQATRAHNERSARAKKAANTRARRSATTATPRKRTARTTTTTTSTTARKATKASKASNASTATKAGS